MMQVRNDTPDNECGFMAQTSDHRALATCRRAVGMGEVNCATAHVNTHTVYAFVRLRATHVRRGKLSTLSIIVYIFPECR